MKVYLFGAEAKPSLSSATLLYPIVSTTVESAVEHMHKCLIDDLTSPIFRDILINECPTIEELTAKLNNAVICYHFVYSDQGPYTRFVKVLDAKIGEST